MRVASNGAGEFLPAITVRAIRKGEKVADIMHEMAELTYKTGKEHALIVLEDGSRMIVKGGSGGITSFPANMKRIILHTHPTTTGPSPEDFEMLEILRQKSSYIFENFGGGLTKFFRKSIDSM